MIKVDQIQQFLSSLDSDWKYPDDTVDTIKSGNPDKEVTGIAVGWMSYWWALKKAVALSCNLFITHEPTYFNHHDTDEQILQFPEVKAKQQYINDEQIIILRCHDLWDHLEGLGIVDSWGKFLGFSTQINGNEFTRIYNGDSLTAGEIAAMIAMKTSSLGLEAVQLIGPADRIVHRFAIGTGAITPFMEWIYEFQIDLAVCTDDGIEYWRDGALAIDLELPIIVVNHPVSEEAGVIQLSKTLQKQFPSIPVHHIPQNSNFTLVFPQDYQT